MKKYILIFERSPQGDFIERVGLGYTQEEAVKSVLDKYFSEHKTQKIRLSKCLEIVA